jgi:hypothetical protein
MNGAADEATQFQRDDASVAAKPKGFGSLASQGILGEFFTALGTEIEPQLLIDVVADLITGRLLHPLQNILDLFEVVAVVIRSVGCGGIERGEHLNLHDVTKIVLGIKLPPAQVA